MEELTEEDVKNMYITPALTKKWDMMTQIRCEQYFTHGAIVVRGNMTSRKKGKKADYILYSSDNMPIAIVEAKRNVFSPRTGMQQAIEYAEILDIPFAYSSNGMAFIEHDMLTGIEREFDMEDFPTPDDLWYRYIKAKKITPTQEDIIREPYYYETGIKKPRYYQRVAINRTVNAIAQGQNRILLVMATGTGKTYTAFQIIYRLWKAKVKRKILYLADRNILIDQTMKQDFQPLADCMTKIENRKMDSSYEIYMALYQQLTDGNGLEIFKQFTSDFFDLIIVDECHRGSAKDNSNWRKILEYFNSATQIGLTATPKEDEDVSNIHYFGEPIYTYSLKDGIDDGFLAPYKVIRVNLDVDINGYRPKKGQLDVYGNPLEDRIYTRKEFDKKLVIDERTELVAKRITEFLKNSNRMDKTIVFCVDIDHAERMRQALINQNSDMVKENSKYIMKITGDDSQGKAELDNFIDVGSPYPVIVTTSKLLTTGVDCKTCKLIVIDTNIESMTEFKQIIGRGTRIREDYGKLFFTIIDFRDATKLFRDDSFNGPAVSIYEPKTEEPIIPKEDIPLEGTLIDSPIKPEADSMYKKLRVNNVNVEIFSEYVQYYDSNGKLVIESLKDFSRKSILNEYETMNDFINKWNSTERKQVIINELEEQGVALEKLREDCGNKEIDDFELILSVAYNKEPLTRQQKRDRVIKKGILEKYSNAAKKVLNQLLDKYVDNNEIDLSDTKILQLRPFDDYGSPMAIVSEFDGKEKYIEAVNEIEKELYAG